MTMKKEKFLIRHNKSKDQRTSGTELLKLSSDKDPRVLLGIASNPNAPNFALHLLADNDQSNIRFEIARNESTSPKNAS